MSDTRDRAKELLSLPNRAAAPALPPTPPRVVGYDTATAQHVFQTGMGAIAHAKIKSSGGVSPGQPLIASAGVAIAKNTVPTQRRRRRPPRTVLGDFKILLRKIIPGAQEYWLGGDREPVLIATIPVPTSPPTTILNAVVANLGRGEDDWVAQIRIKQTVAPPVFPGGPIYTLNSYDPSGLIKSVSYAVVGPGQGNIAYVGHGFWSSMQRKVFTYESIYSGINGIPYRCIPLVNPYIPPRIEIIQTTVIAQDHILVAYDESGVGPRTYGDRTTTIQTKIVISEGNDEFTQVCGEDILNTYVDLEASIKYNKTYWDRSNTINSRFRFMVSSEELSRVVQNSPLYEDYAAIPYNQVVTRTPYVDFTQYEIADTFEFQDDSLPIQIASGITVEDTLKYDKRTHFEDYVTTTLSYSFEEKRNSPLLAGKNAAVYQVVNYKSSGVPAVVESSSTDIRWALKTIDDNGETISTGLAPNTLRPIEEKQHINLIGKKMYIASPSDFNNGTADQDFESTVVVQDITTGVIETKTGVVLNLGSPNNFTIVSMQYYPEE